MSVEVAPYNTDTFMRLPTIITAGSQVAAKGGRDMVYNMLGPIFTKHGVDDK
jgi:hypothetical protein